MLALRWVDPVLTPTMAAEIWRLGAIRAEWRPLGEIAPAMALAAAAAEDSRFCAHRGFDLAEIRAALAETHRRRGASTISQQVAKNLFLWQGGGWVRKGLEAGLTVLIELLWPKRRIMEVYLNIAETGEGLFGVEAAARAHFGKAAAALTPREAALIAAALPSPRTRNPARPSAFLARRAAAIADGAATLRATGRAACFLGP